METTTTNDVVIADDGDNIYAVFVHNRHALAIVQNMFPHAQFGNDPGGILPPDCVVGAVMLHPDCAETVCSDLREAGLTVETLARLLHH
jgi:hypothetical protein